MASRLAAVPAHGGARSSIGAFGVWLSDGRGDRRPHRSDAGLCTLRAVEMDDVKVADEPVGPPYGDDGLPLDGADLDEWVERWAVGYLAGWRAEDVWVFHA